MAAAGIRPPGPIGAATSIEALGIDSVTLVEVAVLMEGRLDCEFDEAQLLGLETFGDLCGLVIAAGRRGARASTCQA